MPTFDHFDNVPSHDDGGMGRGFTRFTILCGTLAAIASQIYEQTELKDAAVDAWGKCAVDMMVGQRRVGNMVEVPICEPAVIKDKEGNRYAAVFSDSLPLGDGNTRLVPLAQMPTYHRLNVTVTRSDDHMRAEQWSPVPSKALQSEIFQTRLADQKTFGLNLLGLRRFAEGIITPSTWGILSFGSRFGGIFVITENFSASVRPDTLPQQNRPQPIQSAPR